MSVKIMPTWPDLMKFNLRQNPIIFDIGGFRGQWTEIAKTYHPDATIYVFEPIKQFYEIIKEKFKNDSKVKVYDYGLSNKNSKVEMNLSGDGSSMHQKGNSTEIIETKDIIEFIFENGISRIDLVKINIEGEEYNLLEHLLDSDQFTMFDNFCIQFHPFPGGYEERRSNILEKAKKYYDRFINYEMIFECWSLKKLKPIGCIGDSHISIYTDHPHLSPESTLTKFENFSVFRVGSWLGYNLPSRLESIRNIINQLPNENLILSFGEIDCRAQISRIAEKNGVSIDEVIKLVVKNIFDAVDQLNYQNLIFQSVAPEIVEKPHHYYYKDHPEDFDAPQGSMADRIEIKEKFQSLMKEECQKRKIKFLDLYQYIANSERKEFYFLDDIHLKSERVHHLIKKCLIEFELYEENPDNRW
jgi:FkbM family methyltransferase